jgi:Flp pilus assembly secretin CpaC
MRILYVAAACAALLTGTAIAQNPPLDYQTKMLPGSVQLIDIEQPYADIIIANPDVADATVVTGGRVALVSKLVGRTNMIFIDMEGHAIANLEVKVVSESQGLEKRLVTIRSFSDQGRKITANMYYCQTDPARNGACSFWRKVENGAEHENGAGETTTAGTTAR